MKLYFTKGACSLVVRIIINELGLKADYESVDLSTKKTEKNEDFLRINPKGAVPTLRLDDGEILTENAVILQYLADNSKVETLLPPIGNFKRYRVLEWLNYISTELHKGFAPLFNSKVPKEVKDTIFIPALEAKFRQVDKKLDGQFVIGGNFTIADAYLYVMLRWASAFFFDLRECSNLMKFMEDLQKRPSVKKSLEQEHILPTT
jgi:glutathione S-transferase